MLGVCMRACSVVCAVFPVPLQDERGSVEIIERNGLRYYRTHLDVTHAVFTRQGGVSPAPFAGLNVGGTVGDDVVNVRANHALMYEALGVNGARAVTTWQVHGADVVAAHGPLPHRKWLARADAIITNQPGVPIAMRFADCLPLLFHDPVRHVIGMAHAGWRGTVQGVGSATVAAMQACYGTRPQDVRAAIGPGISAAHFQVGEEVVAAVEARFGAGHGLARRDPHDGTFYVDLWEANRLDLVRSGVPAENIEVMGLCTYQRTDEFYSHRAEKGRTGRFGTVICL